MKTIKFFSFSILLSLAFFACKEAGSSSSEPTAEAIALDTLNSNKTKVTTNLTNIAGFVDSKITEVETQLAAATGDAKTELETKLETLKQNKANLQTMLTKISESTLENWSTISNEVDVLYGEVKMSLSSANLPKGTTHMNTMSGQAQKN